LVNLNDEEVFFVDVLRLEVSKDYCLRSFETGCLHHVVFINAG